LLVIADAEFQAGRKKRRKENEKLRPGLKMMT